MNALPFRYLFSVFCIMLFVTSCSLRAHTFDSFYSGYFEYPDRFFTVIGLMEQEGVIVDYDQLANQLSPHLIKKDALVRNDVSMRELKIELNRQIEANSFSGRSFSIALSNPIIWDRSSRSFYACLDNGLVPVVSTNLFEFVEINPLYKTIKTERCNKSLVLNLEDQEYKNLLNARKINDTIKAKLNFKLTGLSKTTAIPNVLGYRLTFGYVDAGYEIDD